MLRQAATIVATTALLMGSGCGGRATKDPDGADAADPTGGAEAGDTSGGAGAEASNASGGTGAETRSGGAGTDDSSGGTGAVDSSGGDGAADPSGGADTDDPSGGASAADPSGGAGTDDSSGGAGAADSSGGDGAADPSGGTGAEPSVTGGGGSGGDGGAPADVEPDPCAGVTTDFYFQCYGECSTWTDDSTGLTWTDPPGEDLVWTDALCFCDSLEADGKTDWRLPSIDELRTLITGCEATATGGECGVTDDCLRSTCFDEDLCGGCEENAGPMDGWYLPDGAHPHLTAGFAFTSSPVGDEEGHFWGIDFLTGEVYVGYNEGHAFARCVR